MGTTDRLFTQIAEEDDEIVGLVMAQLTTTHGSGDEKLLYQPPSLFREEECRRVLYVLTLGVHVRHRRRGLARELVRRCVERASLESSCGVVYLHVITHNDGAIQFYKSNGFLLLGMITRKLRPSNDVNCDAGEIQDYYRIDGTLYNCYVYAYYLQKARRLPREPGRDSGRRSSSSSSWALSLLPPSLRSCFALRH